MIEDSFLNSMDENMNHVGNLEVKAALQSSPGRGHYGVLSIFAIKYLIDELNSSSCHQMINLWSGMSDFLSSKKS